MGGLLLWRERVISRKPLGRRFISDGLRTQKDSCERVIVARGYGIEFVIVAARTSDGHAEEGFADRVDLLVRDFERQQFLVLASVVMRAEHEQARGRELRGPLCMV